MAHTMYQCPKCGAREFDPCECCGVPMQPYRAGAPDKLDGFPMVIGDEISPYYDFAIGKMVTSKSRRRKDYEASGTTMRSISDMRSRPEWDAAKPRKTISYRGQTRH